MKIARYLIVIPMLVAVSGVASAEEKKPAEEKAFATGVIDLGVVVSDIEASVKFYTEGIGFTEQTGFSVGGDFGRDAGLADNVPLDIRVLTLGDEAGGTKLKLMQTPGVKNKKSDNTFIHSQLGYSYITIMVTDTTQAVKRLAAIGVKPLAKGPVALPKGFPEGIYLTVVRDPDGNVVELVGPKK
ncbi:VOC family protein [Lignipirellula cremea]|uniref:Glyoxalase-like domain protein n=1 Tax=Lignipirellula cremea TaxID=2528010 RepID=A0A518E3Y0_9BACT|nr:VOC family protein [Lignipirellula cremea]QDU98753.1 Glyoxalase-like domain protein [Lignipirellula cremea]